MATEKEVKIKFTIDGVEKEVDNLKDFTKEMENAGVATKEAEKEGGFFSKQLDSIKEKFKDLGKSFGDLKKGYKTLQSGLSGVAKAFGISGKAANVFGKVTAGAIAATGIGLLVPLVLALVNYFKNLEGGAKALKKIMAGLGAIISNVGKALKLLVSGDFAGAFNTLKDSVNEATSAVDSLFDAEKKLADLRKTTTIENARLNQQIEAQKKILEDTTLSLDDRIAALDKVTTATKKLAENQITETELALQAAQAQLTLTNNYEERREKQQEIAELQAQLIEQQTALQSIEYDAEKVGREIRTQAAEERKAQIEERLAQEMTVSEMLRDLRIEDIQDEQSKAEAQLQVQKEAALATLRENKATQEQLLEAETLYENQLAELRQGYADAAEQKRKEREQKELEEYEAKQARLKEILDAAYFESIESEFQRAQEELQREEQKAMAELELLEATEEQKQQIRDQYQNKREKLAKEEAEYNKALKKAERDNELQLAADAFGAIAGLLGEGTAAQKAAAIAATTIQTYQAAQAAYASQLVPGDPTSPIRATIAAGVAVATGIANVKSILATQTPGADGAGGSVPSRPAAPTFQPPQNTGATGAFQSAGEDVTFSQQGSGGVIKAYVVAEEMTSEQEANRRINELASL
jgi:hypothetical protein